MNSDSHYSQKVREALITVGKFWLRKEYPLRIQAIEKASSEFYMSPVSFNHALDWIFSLWHDQSIKKMISSNPFRSIKNIIQILAGNTPAVMAQAFLQGAILNVPNKIKMPRKQTLFPKLLLQSFAEVSQELAQLFHLDTWEDRYEDLYTEFHQSDLVIAYGSNETIEAIRPFIPPSTIFIPEAHAISCAIIFKNATTINHLEKLALDMLSYDQRGCLSPRVTFVERGGALSPLQCATLFAEEILPKMAMEYPGGQFRLEESLGLIQARALYRFRGQVFAGSDWTVCYDEERKWPDEALPRFMPFKPFNSWNELMILLQPVLKNLIGISYAGGKDTIMNFKPPALRLKCPIGMIQRQMMPYP